MLLLRRIQLKMPRFERLPFTILVVLAGLMGLRAQQPTAATEDYVRAHYTKYEFRIPMRDGKRLFTAVYVPKDAAGRAVSVSDGPHAL